MNGTIEYKVALFIKNVLTDTLDKNRKKLLTALQLFVLKTLNRVQLLLKI